MLKMITVVALFAWLIGGETASATDVTGKVHLNRDAYNAPVINRYPGREAAQSSKVYKPESLPPLRAVVYLTGGKPVKIGPTMLEKKEIKQVNQEFVPRVLPILVGTTVDFPNMDPIFHNVFSYSKTKKFDLGRYAKGHSKSVTFDKPGVVRVFCEIHSNMLAHIIVLKQPYFTVTEQDGSFRIEGVPAGEYDLHIWQENAPEQVTHVLIPDQKVFVVEVQE